MTFLSPQAVGALCALGSALTWAATSLLVRTVCPPLSSVTVSVLRSLMGGGLLLAWVLAVGGLAKLGGMSAGTFALLAVSIVLAIAVGDVQQSAGDEQRRAVGRRCTGTTRPDEALARSG